jgi:hypothetical protein
MADQKLNAAKVEYLDTDLGGARHWLVPKLLAQIPTLGTWRITPWGRGGGVEHLTIRPPFSRGVTNFRA